MTLPTLSAARWQNTLTEVTRRIVETARPQRIVLFGSATRGKLTRDSDLDVLVIMRGPVHRRQLAQKIQRNLHGVDLPVDVVVVTEEDVQNSAQGGFSIVRPALAEGKVLYDAR
ncbi:MAG: nucleotidyltransferase domain-containing protein [Chloroflexi bacterium]|nr:MAG: nucleotidyltransferase domain-containing protein [Chloroflexota bacterium]